MRLSPSDAARLFKIHRATLYRHMASGRLSWVLEPDGRRVLDLSELIRCYGEPSGHATPATPPEQAHATADATPATERLLAELVELTRRQGEEVRLLREEVASLRRLPPPENYQDASKENQAQTEADDPHGFRAIVKKIYANDERGKSN
ncbi:hypothetical protein [Kushneria sp. EE4]